MVTYHGGLSDSLLTAVALNTQSATGVVNGAALDMQGYDNVRFTVQYGVFGTNGTLDIGPLQVDDNSGFNSPTNIGNSTLTQITNANGVAIVELFRNAWPAGERYVRLQVKGQTNGVTVGATADRYRANARVMPPTQSAVQYLKVTG